MKRTIASSSLIILFVGSIVACGGSSSSSSDAGTDSGPADAALTFDWTRDIVSTDLQVDVTAQAITATLVVAGSQTGLVSLQVGDTELISVKDDSGADLNYEVDESNIHVSVPRGDQPVTIVVAYTYELHTATEGATTRNSTLTWPYHCGNLFPCKPNPDDGLTFTATLTNIPDGLTAVYPRSIPADGPPYMFAWAIGGYEYLDLGTTDAGTQVGAYYFPNGLPAATNGTADLRQVIDWLEKNIGGYIFGNEMAAVAANWGSGAYGGMEHHPLWHTSRIAMSDPVVQAHEAAHGWFGNGVRIACWEDFVLSEGVAEYLAARALIAVGSSAGVSVWLAYRDELNALNASSTKNKIAWPEGCNELDIIDDGLFGGAPYTKGAYFLKGLAAKLGDTAVDSALGAFYSQYKGKAARMQDLLDVIKAETGYDPQACALKWLRSNDAPTVEACE